MKKIILALILLVSMVSNAQVLVKNNPTRQRTISCFLKYQVILTAQKVGYDSSYTLTYEDADYKYSIDFEGRKTKEDFLSVLKKAAFSTDFIIFEVDGIEIYAKQLIFEGERYVWFKQKRYEEGGYVSIAYRKLNHLFFK